MDEIILIGAGGHARSCIDVVECENHFKIAGLVGKNESIGENTVGYPVIGVDDDLEGLRQRFTYALVTVGQIKSSETRTKIYELLKSLEFQLPIITSPSAYVSKHARIGEGSIVMHSAIANSNAHIGVNCIINNKALVEHDAKIGDHCHIATGAIVNGGVQVGEGSFIGSGAVARQGISIGNQCVIGAGCAVRHNVSDKQIVKN